MRLCPVCNRGLEVKIYASVHVEPCPRCGGFWFDNHELSWLTQRAPDKLRALEAQFPDRRDPSAPRLPAGVCPVCNLSLVPHEFAHARGIIMDVCRKCHGIWLDHGKLSQIEDRLREFQQAKAARQKLAAQTPPAVAPSQAVKPPSATAAPDQPKGIAIHSAQRCKKCGAENPRHAQRCSQCGTALPPPGRWKPGYCPRCHLGMYPARRSGYILQACSRCEGIWLPRDILDDIMARHFNLMRTLDTNFQLHRHTPEEERAIHRCPDCVVDLVDEDFCFRAGNTSVQTSVLTHRCPNCNGVWFDAGEIHAIWKEVSEAGAAPG